MLAPDLIVIMASKGELDKERIRSFYDEVQKVLPQDKKRLCILGGQEIRNNDVTKPLIQQIAKQLPQFSDNIVVLTGGLKGVQQHFAQNVGDGVSVFNLLPKDQSSNYGVGQDIACGTNLQERMAVFGEIGDIYLSFEGGGGVGGEATAAFNNGALVLPLRATGGASEGKFGFPEGALAKPEWAPPADWDMLKEGEASKVAPAVARLIRIRLYGDSSKCVCCQVFTDMLANFFGPPAKKE